MVKRKSRPQTKSSKQEIKTYKQRLHWIEIQKAAVTKIVSNNCYLE